MYLRKGAVEGSDAASNNLIGEILLGRPLENAVQALRFDCEVLRNRTDTSEAERDYCFPEDEEKTEPEQSINNHLLPEVHDIEAIGSFKAVDKGVCVLLDSIEEIGGE